MNAGGRRLHASSVPSRPRSQHQQGVRHASEVRQVEAIGEAQRVHLRGGGGQRAHQGQAAPAGLRQGGPTHDLRIRSQASPIQARPGRAQAYVCFSSCLVVALYCLLQQSRLTMMMQGMRFMCLTRPCLGFRAGRRSSRRWRTSRAGATPTATSAATWRRWTSCRTTTRRGWAGCSSSTCPTSSWSPGRSSTPSSTTTPRRSLSSSPTRTRTRR
jgi:hypothetical protein